MNALTHPRMSADEFLAWSLERPDGERYELLDGEIVAMTSERSTHAKLKGRVYRRLEDAMERAGLAGEVFPDGMAVRISASTVYEPDVGLRLGDPIKPDAISYDDPVILVEVLSPSTGSVDAGAKLADYFTLSSLRHYLILRSAGRMLIHHARQADGSIRTRILANGELRLDPPGLVLDVPSLFP